MPGQLPPAPSTERAARAPALMPVRIERPLSVSFARRSFELFTDAFFSVIGFFTVDSFSRGDLGSLRAPAMSKRCAKQGAPCTTLEIQRSHNERRGDEHSMHDRGAAGAHRKCIRCTTSRRGRSSVRRSRRYVYACRSCFTRMGRYAYGSRVSLCRMGRDHSRSRTSFTGSRRHHYGSRASVSRIGRHVCALRTSFTGIGRHVCALRRSFTGIGRHVCGIRTSFTGMSRYVCALRTSFMGMSRHVCALRMSFTGIRRHPYGTRSDESPRRRDHTA